MRDEAAAGKTIVITGASSGIGAAAAQELVAGGATVAIVGRSPGKTAEVAQRLGVEAFLADFADLAQVRSLAERLLDRFERIDVLANNAGGAWPKRTTTVDGNELTFQVNHLAPFLLTNLLLDRLTASGARVVNTASMTYRSAKLDLDAVNAPTGRFSQLGNYGSSKLANVIFTRELARRTEGTGLTAVAFHPGVVATHVYDEAPFGIGNVIRTPLARPFFITPEQGAQPLVHLATLADIEPLHGTYFHRFSPEEPRNKRALDAEFARRLWEMSQHATA